MTRSEVIEQAFARACKFIRDHPPIMDSLDEIGIVDCIYQGDTDPKGLAWAKYFIDQVLNKEK